MSTETAAPPRNVTYTEESTLTIEDDKPTIAKAVIAGVTTLSGTLMTALADNGVTSIELVAIVSGTIVAVASVWAVTNKRS